MPNVALRAAATRYQQHTLEGPGESGAHPCAWDVRSPTRRKSIPIHQEAVNAPVKANIGWEATSFP